MTNLFALDNTSSLTLFDNSTDNRFHDQSWVSQTAPSTVVTENASGAGVPNGDKLPSVITPVKAGANALKLQWKSTEGGAWMALVASVGWKSFDLTTMKQLKFWVYSPVALAKTALPKFFFESHSGTPKISGKLPLANYLANGLVANTWTEVIIPLADVWAAGATYIAKDVVKGIFFEQNTADNVEHTLYMDEFSFETNEAPPAITTLTLFDNSTDNRFHDQSWVNQTAPSTVVAEKVNPTDTPEKLPVVTSPVKAGANALKLQWTSTNNGGWMALIASVGWKAFNLTTMKQLKFWVYSPVALAKTTLPKFFFESHSGTPKISGKLPLANYLANGLVANTWTEVSVPLADVWAADATYVAKDVVKGVFFEQNTADNISHILYLDEFTFTSTTTGLDIRLENKNFSAYYTNGEIHIPNFSGFVEVFDLVGRSVAEGAAFDGKLGVNLKNGIYIVKTNLGNTKIVLQ